jgi:oligopeptide transport system substrate-binding protein
MFAFNKMTCNYEKREVIRYRLSFARLSCASGSSSSKSSSSSKAQKLSWTEAAELTAMDPSKATDRYDADQFNNVMEGLIRLGNNAKPTLGIAKSW